MSNIGTFQNQIDEPDALELVDWATFIPFSVCIVMCLYCFFRVYMYLCTPASYYIKKPKMRFVPTHTKSE